MHNVVWVRGEVKKRFFFEERNELSNGLLVFTDVKTRFGVFQKLFAQRERVAEWNDAIVKRRTRHLLSTMFGHVADDT